MDDGVTIQKQKIKNKKSQIFLNILGNIANLVSYFQEVHLSQHFPLIFVSLKKIKKIYIFLEEKYQKGLREN